MPARRADRPSRTEGRIVLNLLRDGLTNPDGWTPDERAAVTRFHLWAHGAPPNLGARPTPSTTVEHDPRIAGWILTPDDLDRLTVLARDDEPAGLEDRLVADDPHATCRAVQAGEREAAEEQADALRSEVARLSALLDEATIERDGANELAERARESEETWRREVEEQTGRAEREHAARLRAERLLAAQQETTGHLRTHLDAERTRAERAEGLGDEPAPPEPWLRPVADDPRRPHPGEWPDDAVLLRYVELRRLVSLHLERYADANVARAMLEGDVPLRLGEVLQ